jgi:hypothetical protein
MQAATAGRHGSFDGSRIAFARDDGRSGLFDVDADGKAPERELLRPDKDSNAMYAHGYTRDGRTLLVGRFGPARLGGLFTQSLDGKPGLVEFLDSPANELFPRLSPDNRWVAYLSNETGRDEVYVERFPSRGSKTQVSNGFQGIEIRWRADGGELFYVALDNRLMAVPMKDGRPMGLPVSLFDLGANVPFAVSKDGQRFLITAPVTGSDAKTVEVVMNWTALLKR